MSGSLGEIRGELVVGSNLKGLEAAEAGLKNLGGGSDTASKSLDNLSTSGNKAVQTTVDVGDALSVASQGIAKVTSAIGDAVVQAADYNVAITNIGTLSSETNKRLGEYEKGILSVSAALGQDATNSAKAAYDALSSGIEAGKAVEFLGVAGKAATAGLTTMDSAGKALTVTLNSFNLGADQATAVSDAMFAAANVGVTTFDELAQSFGGVASIASASGAGYKETLAVLAQITTKGVGTSEAVTQMKAAFTALSKPTADVKASLEAAGFASAEAAIKQKGLAFVLDLVRQTSVDTGKPLIELVGSTEAVNAILTTTGDNAGQTADKIATLQSSAGATAAAFDLISETPAQKMAVLRSSVSNLATTFGTALLPILGSLLDGLNPLIQSFTSFASRVLTPLSAAFSAMPGPIRTVIAGLIGLTVAGVALVGSIVAAQVAYGPLVDLFKSGATEAAKAGAGSLLAAGGISVQAGATGLLGTASSLASAGVSTLAGAMSALWATVAPLLLPLAALVGAVALVGASLQASSAAWEAEREAAIEAGGSYDDFTQAAARARTESGLLASIGFTLRDSMAAGSDQWRIGMAAIKDSLSSAKAGVSEFFAGLRGDGTEADGLARVAKEIEQNKQVTIDAGAAFLELGTNMAPAVRESDAFKLGQAKLNEELRNGDISAAEYKARLVELADATSRAAGQGAVLTKAQQDRAASEAGQIASHAKLVLGMSEAAMQSEGYAALQRSLSDAVAKGGLSHQAALAAVDRYAEGQKAAAAEAENSLTAYSLTASGLDSAVVASEEFQAQIIAQAEAVAAGNVSLQDAQANLKLFAEQAQAAQAAAAFELSGDIKEFGVSRVTNDDEMKEEEKNLEAAGQKRAELFSEFLQARKDNAAAEVAVANENAQRLAEAEVKAQEQIAEAQTKGDADSIAKAQAAAAERINTVKAENAERVTELRSGFAAEQAERQTAIAQASLDQVNAMLRLGTITEQQAQVIFGSLKSAFPGAELFDPAAEAAMRFNAQFGRAVTGDTEAAVGLGEAIKGIDASLDESEAKAGEYASTSVAAYQAAREELGLAADSAAAAAASLPALGAAGAIAAEGVIAGAQASNAALATVPPAAMEAAGGVAQAGADMRASEDETSANLATNAGERNATRAGELEAQLSAGGGIRSDLTETKGVSAATASSMQGDAAKTGQAQAGLAQTIQSEGGKIEQTQKRLQGEMTNTGKVATSSVAGIGGAYQGAAGQVDAGGKLIVSSVNKTNQSFQGLGSGTTAAIEPAIGGVRNLASEVETLGGVAASIGESRVEAEEGAGKAAQRAGDDTVSSFSDQTRAGETLERKVVDVRKAFEGLPRKVEIPLEVAGIDKIRQQLAALQKDLDRLRSGAGGIGGGPGGGGGGGGRNPGPISKPVLDEIQGSVQSLRQEAAKGVSLPSSYNGAGPMAWSAGGLALGSAIGGIFDQAADPLVIRAEVEASAEFAKLVFDRPKIAEDLARANAELARLAGELRGAEAASASARTVLDRALTGLNAAIDRFFTNGGLTQVLRQFKELGVELDRDFFVQAGILDVSSFEQLRQQLASLAGEPEKQQDLWDAFIDGLENRWRVYYENQSNQLERQKREIEAQVRAAKAADPESEPSDEQAARLAELELKIQALKDQNDDLANVMRDQTYQVGAQLDLVDRLQDALDDRVKTEKEITQEIERQRKAAEDALKSAQKVAIDAENDAHDEAMDLLDAAVERRKRARDLELKAIERQVKAAERDHKRRQEDEETFHEERLRQITAEADALDEQNRIEDEAIKRARTLVDALRKGGDLTADQLDFLRSQGLDPETIKKGNAELEETARRVDQIQRLLDKLPEGPGRIRDAAGRLLHESGKAVRDAKGAAAKVSAEERAALQAALDAGTLNEKDARIASIFLAGGVVQSERLQEILAGLVDDSESKLEAAEAERDVVGEILDKRQLELTLAQDTAKAKRDALAGEIAAEEARHEDAKSHLGDELAALKERQSAIKDAWDAELSALADAKKAEEDRHKDRMQQILQEYALQLLLLGKSDAEAQKAVDDMAKRSATIAEEARRRYEEALAEAERLRKEREADDSRITLPPAEPEPIGPGIQPRPGPPALPPPPLPPPPSTDSFLMNTLRDAVDLKSVMTDLAALGFKAPNHFTVNQTIDNSTNRTFTTRDVTVIDGSETADALLDALGRN